MDPQRSAEQRAEDAAKANPDPSAQAPLERNKERTGSISQRSDDSQTAAE